MLGIYCYVDKKDNSIVYVGKDSNIHEDKRHKSHFHPSQYNKQQINRVLQNNPDRYTYQVLVFDVKDDDTLNDLEIQYIRQLHPKFNYTKGGDGLLGFKHSEETRKKISEKIKDENHHMYGNHHSEETKKKISENNARYWQDKTFSEEHCKNISKSLTGKKFSEEHKKKISKALKGKKISDGTKDKISKSKSKVQNTSGYYRVCKAKNKRYKQGFRWSYQYYENGKHKEISSVDIKKLEEKVKEKGLEWEELNDG